MKSKSDLFELIQAMSKSEKRYFTLDAQKSGRKAARYLELFHAINEMEVYDEQKLKKYFPKNLPTDKNYLYEAILRSMRDYRSANSYAARIKELMLDAKYLYERGLYEQSEERLNIAKNLAYELGDQLSVLELNKEHRRLLRDTKPKDYEEDLEELIAEKSDSLGKLKEELTFLDALDRLLIEIRKNPQQRSDIHQKETLKHQFSHLIEIQDTEPATIQGKLRFFQSMALLYQLLDEPDHVYEYFSKIVECWDSSSKYKEEEFSRYVFDFSNLIHATFSNYDRLLQVPVLLEKLEKEQPKNLHDQKVLFQKTTAYRLMYYINTGDFRDVKNIINRIEKGLKQYDVGAGSEMVITFNVATLLFMAEDFESCVAWVEKLINQNKLPVREDIRNASRMLNLFAVFEVGDFEAIEACIRNTSRYLKKAQKGEENFNPNMLNYIKRLHNSSPAEHRHVLLTLKDYITDLKNKGAKIPLGLEELVLLWVESKISKKSIAWVMQSNLQQAGS